MKCTPIVHGKQRVVIENIKPLVHQGRFPVKASVGEQITIEADIFADGQDVIHASVLYRLANNLEWTQQPLYAVWGDYFKTEFKLQHQGLYQYKINAWIDHPLTWLRGSILKINDGQHITTDLLEGINFLKNSLEKVYTSNEKATRFLKEGITFFSNTKEYEKAIAFLKNTYLKELFRQYPTNDNFTESPIFELWSDRQAARFSTWYTMFPRSASAKINKHGTLNDVTNNVLPYIKAMGFDVLHLPPVHPIGWQFRKGKDNTPYQKGDVGCPYAIGSELGGHDTILPELGTLSDFLALIQQAERMGIELAMDYAVQFSPDHPWASLHPEWFKVRPDGTIRCAETPPHLYEDIYPVDFECEDWQNLWNALKDIALLWASWGIRILRVDNPHTKSFAFWEWLIKEIQMEYPDMIFLAESFTKPSLMIHLAKVGFSQSYTYFIWKNSKQELTDYVNELTKSDLRHFMRPNFCVNTHDILPWGMQTGLEPVFLTRYFLSATLSSVNGIFGPAFENMISDALPNCEEYRHSEKYEIRKWDWHLENKLTLLIGKTNQARLENTALQQTNDITFCEIQNDQVIAYVKTASDGNCILCIVNLDPHNAQGGMIKVPLHKINKNHDEHYIVHDLLTDARYTWKGDWNFVDLNPHIMPMHLFRIENH